MKHSISIQQFLKEHYLLVYKEYSRERQAKKNDFKPSLINSKHKPIANTGLCRALDEKANGYNEYRSEGWHLPPFCDHLHGVKPWLTTYFIVDQSDFNTDHLAPALHLGIIADETVRGEKDWIDC